MSGDFSQRGYGAPQPIDPSGWPSPGGSDEVFGEPPMGFGGSLPARPHGHEPVPGAPGDAPGRLGNAKTRTGGMSAVQALIPSLVSGAVAIILALVVLVGPFHATGTAWIVLAGLGWLLAGIVGVSLLSLYYRASAEERSAGKAIISSMQSTLFYATIAVLGVGILGTALEVALWFGKG